MDYSLNNGLKMPKIGLGTWQLTDEEKLTTALGAACDCGYKLIDTAAIYKNEQVIGKFLNSCLKEYQMKREDIFITSKLWNADHNDPRKACIESLQKLQTNYLDLYLIHWPVNFKGEFNLQFVWKEMEKLVDEGLVKSIGVSNFGLKNLNHLMSICRIKPVVNQIEMHPYLPQKEIREFCSKNGIIVISYSTLGSTPLDKSVVDHAKLKNEPVIVSLASKYNCSTSKILLSYAVQEGCAIIPRSSTPDHIKENLSVIEMKDDELEQIRNIQTRMRFVDPDFGSGRFE